MRSTRRVRPDAAARPKPRPRDPLLAAICHDLRAPLAAVTMGANFVLQTTPDDEANSRQRHILEAMLRSCAQMERLVRNFADLSEIESGSLTLRLGEHDTGEMVELAAEASADVARARRVTLRVEKPEQKITACCDRDRLLRAIGHIVENALQVAPPESEVVIGVQRRGSSVAFRVTDHGAGIAGPVRRNLFDRHWHAKRASRVGAGLGLGIARGFAVAHGGRIDVASHPGETSVTITVPAAGPHGAAPARGAGPSPSPAAAKPKPKPRRPREPRAATRTPTRVTPARRRSP
jgi:signal transduction histidine kinase